MATLDLIARPRRLVFREIVALLQADPELDRVVETWLAWTGDDDSHVTPTADMMPAIRLSPDHSEDGFYGPCGRIGSLDVVVETWTLGLDYDDQLDLWGCIEQCFALVKNATRQRLVALGAETGEPLIAYPAYATAEDDGRAVALHGRGGIRLKVQYVGPDN